ncbi:hypothetical protein CEXT_489381 [Caerostris extrusa]|uniref:Uncharacterized protein n=1 Tax=Caerostris extrusa TaxID=172846 RepID=A0AAV4T7I7_CAEEX|nr:hypothetical protein CEXT_489381 [Caerostris extrusa]
MSDAIEGEGGDKQSDTIQLTIVVSVRICSGLGKEARSRQEKIQQTFTDLLSPNIRNREKMHISLLFLSTKGKEKDIPPLTWSPMQGRKSGY